MKNLNDLNCSEQDWIEIENSQIIEFVARYLVEYLLENNLTPEEVVADEEIYKQAFIKAYEKIKKISEFALTSKEMFALTIEKVIELLRKQ